MGVKMGRTAQRLSYALSNHVTMAYANAMGRSSDLCIVILSGLPGLPVTWSGRIQQLQRRDRAGFSPGFPILLWKEHRHLIAYLVAFQYSL